MAVYKVYYHGIPGSGISGGTYIVEQFASGKQAREYVERVVFNGQVRTSGANMLDGNAERITDTSDWGRVQDVQPTVPPNTFADVHRQAQHAADEACTGDGAGGAFATLVGLGAVGVVGVALVGQGLAGVGALFGGIVDGFNSTQPQVEQVQPQVAPEQPRFEINAQNCARYYTATECAAIF